MTPSEIVDVIVDLNPDALIPTAPDGSRMYDEALTGYVDRCSMTPVACYDREKCIKWLQDHGMGGDYHDAMEYFDVNVAGAYVGEHGPVFLTIPV